MEPCPVCKSTEQPKYDRTSRWCIDCSNVELDIQAELEAIEIVRKQTFTPK